jgi:hypothetical protein
MQTIDGIINEPTVNFVGKDGFFWWVGEVEDVEDPMELGRVKVRVLGYYTNVRGGTTTDLPTEALPWATVMQHTSQAGNDSQGESSGQLQPGAIVMGFFLDGESAQMPLVMGVLRVNKNGDSQDTKEFAFTGEKMQPGLAPGAGQLPPGETNILKSTHRAGNQNNSVALPNSKTVAPGGIGQPANIGTQPGIAGSSSNSQKPRNPEKPIPAGNGVGGPWKTLEYKLSYLVEDIANTAGSLVKNESGNFLDVVSGKLVTAEMLTSKLQNFLSSVFTQVISAIRQQFSQLTEQLSIASLLGGATGAPYIIYTIIQQAIQQILSALCLEDSKLMGYISDPIGSVVSLVEGFLDAAISKAEMVLQGVQDVIDSVICQVQSIINTMQDVVSTVVDLVQGFEQVQAIIETWKEGSKIFEEGTDLIQQGISNITGLISFFLNFFSSGCNREAHGGKDTVGWFPMFGVTHCTDAELDEINRIRGRQRGDCGSNDAGASLWDSLYKEADPYLTAAKTFINGAYELHVGTPGRQATVKKSENGTTHTSVNYNNSSFSEYQFLRQLRKSNPDITQEELDKKYNSYVKKNAGSKGDTGNLVADHSSYAGNYTQEVHGDDCKLVDGDYVRTIDGSYHLKITGDCHLEVGGGFFMSAEGAPTVAPKNGASQNEKIQKHTIRLGSDLDFNVAGGKLGLQASEIELASQANKIAGSSLEVSCMNQSYSGGEIMINANNSIEFNTVSEYHFINFPTTNPISAKSGIFNSVRGSVDYIITPGGSAADAVPRFNVINPSGPVNFTCGATGYNCSVTTGAFNVDVVAGLFRISSSTVGTIDALGALNLSSEGIVRVSGKSIFLN